MKVIINKKWADYQEGEEADINDKAVLKACVRAGIIESSDEINKYVKEEVVEEEAEQSEESKTITSEGKKKK